MASSRRDFIKIGALSSAGLIFSSTLLKAFTKDNSSVRLGEEKFVRTPTYCEVCFWKCAGWVYKNDDGSIKKIIGNDDDPNCNGRFCPRGTGGVGMYTDTDRLKKPLMRVGERGKQTFKEVEWDEAYNFIAQKMNDLKAKYGAESMALFSHGSGGSYFTTLLKAYGSGNMAQPSYAQCKGPRDAAFIATFGMELNSPENTDIRDTECLVLIGSHIGENMHNGHVQEMSDAIDKRACIITVDPRFSTAASKSKYWLPIKPGTDTALLLSWMHVIIEEELYDKAYLDQHAIGFDKLVEHVKPFTPEWAYGITTIHPDQIRATAREMGKASPATLIHPGRHVTWYGDDTQRLRAVAILNALLGSWGRRGGFYMPIAPHLPKVKLPPFPKPAKTWANAHTGLFPMAEVGLANTLVEASIPEYKRDLQIKGWIVNGTNLIETLPNRADTLKAIDNLELLVVVDTMPMEITGYADIVLPECTYLERYDSLRATQHREEVISLRMPATEPLYDTKSSWQMAKELANKLDLGAYFPYETQAEELDWQLKQIGSSLEEMKRIGVKVTKRGDGELYFKQGEPQEFATPSGKIELYSETYASYGFDPMPLFTPNPEPPAGYYRLIYGRAPMHTFTRTANNPHLTDLMDENTVWVNPKVAKEWGLKNNQLVHLENQDGVVSSFAIKVRVTERIRWDSVYMVHGFGHQNKALTRAFGRGASDTQLITTVKVDPIMGGTGMRGNFVTFKV